MIFAGILAIWSCHIWLVARIKFASLKFGSMPFSLSYSSFCLPPFRRSTDLTGILLTKKLNLNSTNQSK